jgi:hypothetical protein
MVSWRENVSGHVTCVQREASDQENREEMHYNILPKCDVGLCTGQCFEMYHIKLHYWE